MSRGADNEGVATTEHVEEATGDGCGSTDSKRGGGLASPYSLEFLLVSLDFLLEVPTSGTSGFG
jgi:hypothetical protein